MSSRPSKSARSSPHERASPTVSSALGIKPRSALGAYIVDPSRFPPSVVLYHTPSFVAVADAYPKASVHLLLLPRDPAVTLLHPFDALNSTTPELAAFLAAVRAEAGKLRGLAAEELRRRFGAGSAGDAAYVAALAADEPPAREEMPAGREWEGEVMVGVHARPSMQHLHVHVMSRDRRSSAVKHRKHYNSFATPFFVPLEDFPLAAGDPRREPTREGYLKRDLCCWRCGKNFGAGFARLKEHLEVEFEEWKKL